jgi:hypothetical protein
MNERVKHIVDQARQLTPEERADLCDLLLVMMHAAPADLGDGWEEEIERRLEEADRGEVVLQDFDEAMNALRSKI